MWPGLRYSHTLQAIETLPVCLNGPGGRQVSQEVYAGIWTHIGTVQVQVRPLQVGERHRWVCDSDGSE
jgi:hypothetical protein